MVALISVPKQILSRNRQTSPKSFTPTIHWSLAEPAESYLGNIAHQRLTIPKQMVAEPRKELLQYCCNLAWMTRCGLIPWNVTVICELFKTSYRTGRTPYELRFGESFRGPQFFSDRRLSIIRFLPKTSQDSTSLVRKFCQESSKDMYCMRGAFGNATSLSQTRVSWKCWTRQKFMLEDSMRRRSSCRKTVNISYSRSHVVQLSCLEEIRFSEDPSQFRITLHEKRTAQGRSSRRVGRVSTVKHSDG